MRVNYDCEDLIDELKKDIKEFGDFEAYAFFEKIEEFLFLTNYEFVYDKKTPKVKNDLIVQIMKASEMLKILEEQNKII